MRAAQQLANSAPARDRLDDYRCNYEMLSQTVGSQQRQLRTAISRMVDQVSEATQGRYQVNSILAPEEMLQRFGDTELIPMTLAEEQQSIAELELVRRELARMGDYRMTVAEPDEMGGRRVGIRNERPSRAGPGNNEIGFYWHRYSGARAADVLQMFCKWFAR